MGYERCHAIVVADRGYGDFIEKAHEKATSLRMCVTPIVAGMVNHVRSFAALPDGSKEGWEESDVGDTARDGLVAFLRSLYYEDGSSPLCWVEVQFGDDEHVTRVDRSSDEDQSKRRSELSERVAPNEGQK